MAVGKSVTLGLFAAWLAHDLEEWFTIGPWSRSHARPELGPRTVDEAEVASHGGPRCRG